MCCLLIRTQSDKIHYTASACCSKEESRLLSHLSYKEKENKTDISLNYEEQINKMNNRYLMRIDFLYT